MRSWRKKTSIMLVIILVAAMGLLIWTNWFYNREIRQSVLEENTNAIALWAERVDSSLDTVNKHILEMMTIMISNMEVRTGSPVMPLSMRADLLNKMDRALSTSGFADCFFVLDGDTDALLLSTSRFIGYDEWASIRGIISSLDEDDIDSVMDKTWTARCPDGGKPYFFKAYHLGKYTVGAACKIINFDITKAVNLRGKNTSCLLIGKDGAYFCGGDIDRSGQIRFDSRGEPCFDGKTEIIKGSFTKADVTAVLSVEAGFLFGSPQLWVSILLAACSIFFVLLLLFFSNMMHTEITVPTQELLHANNEISAGNIQYRITEPARSEEFLALFGSFNTMAGQISQLRIEAYDQLLADRENRLRLLRAQVKPHFYLNAITTINNMTYLGRNEDVRSFCQALAKYMRYMLNVQSNWTTIGEELTHISNYTDMQKLRSPGKIELSIDCPEELEATRIPIMVLFTVVENSFKHALNPHKQLCVRITVKHTETENFAGCRVTIEDNGDGFPENILEQMNRPIDGSLPAKEHLGLSNVRYTLLLSYNRNDLFHVRNRNAGGSAVEISIPDKYRGRTVEEL